MIEKLKEIISKYNTIESKMSDPSLVNNLDEFKKVTNTGQIRITHSNHIPTKNYNISGKAFFNSSIWLEFETNESPVAIRPL